MQSRTVLSVLLLCTCVVWVAAMECDEYAHCNTCAANTHLGFNCRWCPIDNQCHDAGSAFNPCAAGKSITNTSMCIPLPPCQGVNPATYDPDTSLTMIAFSKSAYTTPDPRSAPQWPAGAKLNVTFSAVCDATPVNGYAALQHTEKRIVMVFEGTAGFAQLVTEILNGVGTQFKGFGPEMLVMSFFLNAYEKLEAASFKALADLQVDYPSYSIYVTGHSLGGALADLFAIGSVVEKVAKKAPILYTFGQPRVGNQPYADLHLQLLAGDFRLVNNRDPVPHIPPMGAPSLAEVRSSRPGAISWAAQVERERKGLAEQAVKEGMPISRAFPAQDATEVKQLVWARHHGWELWYPAGEYQETVMCGNRFCCGKPIGEDPACSDSLTFDCGDLFKLCVGDHSGYWLVLPHGWCKQ